MTNKNGDRAEEVAKELAQKINDGFGSADDIAQALRDFGDERAMEATEKEFMRLMGACWPKGMRADILDLLKTKTIQGEIDLNWMEDSIGEMLQLSIAQARAEALEEAAKVAEDCDHAHSCEGPQIAREIRALQTKKPAGSK